MKVPLSVVILALNEKERMKRCLSSVRDFQQVVLIDSLSSDGTLDEARDLWNGWGEDPNALTLVSRPWPGFTQARNESLKWVRSPWVMWLDADEWVSEELKVDLKLKCATPEKIPAVDVVYEIPRQSYFLGRKIKYGGWYPDFKKRIAPTHLADWRKGPQESDVHEDLFLKTATRFERIAGAHIFHEGFRNEQEQRETNDLYSTLLAAGLSKKWIQEKKVPPSALFIFFKPWVKFLENYFFKLGFLDGLAGYKIAKGSAWSMKQRLLKARNLYVENSSMSDVKETLS